MTNNNNDIELAEDNLKYKRYEKEALDKIVGIQNVEMKYYVFFGTLYSLFKKMLEVRKTLFGDKAKSKSDFYKNVVENATEHKFDVAKILKLKYSKYSVFKENHRTAIKTIAKKYLTEVNEIYTESTSAMKKTLEELYDLDQKSAFIMPKSFIEYGKDDNNHYVINNNKLNLKAKNLSWKFDELILPKHNTFVEYTDYYPINES